MDGEESGSRGFRRCVSAIFYTKALSYTRNPLVPPLAHKVSSNLSYLPTNSLFPANEQRRGKLWRWRNLSPILAARRA
jgi:hypothetical protein